MRSLFTVMIKHFWIALSMICFCSMYAMNNSQGFGAIDAQNEWGDTKLLIAIVNKKYDEARDLLERGASVSIKNANVLSALNFATAYGNFTFKGSRYYGSMEAAHLLLKMYDTQMIRNTANSLVSNEICSNEMRRFVKIIRSPGYLTKYEKNMLGVFHSEFAEIAFESKAWNDALKNIMIPILRSLKPKDYETIVTAKSVQWLCHATKNYEVGKLFVPFLPKATFLMMHGCVRQLYEKRQDPSMLAFKTYLNNEYKKEKMFSLLPLLKDTHFQFVVK